ncbi:MAG: hypothetical protein II825_07940 [Paludibacteraceae bacterium]|nr:hypothetical protein [Paludibacteraceae bacterium]
MKNRLIYVILFAICSSIYSYGVRPVSQSDSIRHFLESIGEEESIISQLIQCTSIPYDSIVYYYEIGASYNKVENVWCWTLYPSRVKLTNSYYIHRIINDTVIFPHINILFNSSYADPKNYDSLIYCFQYASEHFRDPFAAGYYQMLCEMNYQENMTIDSECLFLNALMEYTVITGNLEYFASKTFTMFPYDSLLHAEIRHNRECRDAHTYYKSYNTQITDFYMNGALLHIDDEVKNKLESTLVNGVSCNERCCTILLAFSKITGVVLDKDILMGKQLLISLCPQMEESEFWECKNIMTSKQQEGLNGN